MKKISWAVCIGMLGASHSYAEDLVEVYQQAKQNDLQLLKAEIQKKSAFKQISATRSALLPQINLTAGYSMTSSNRDENQMDVMDASIQLTQSLFQRDKWLGLDQSEKQAHQAGVVYASQQQGLMVRVAKAYFDVLLAQDDLVFTQAEKAAVSRQLDQTKQRFKVGLSAVTDVQEAQAEYDTALASEVSRRNVLDNSYEALREITAHYYRDLAVLDKKRFTMRDHRQPPGDLIRQAEKQNLNLLSARIAREMARDDIKMAKSGHLPSLNLDASYGLQDISNTGLEGMEHQAKDLSVGVRLVVPVYAGGGTVSRVEQAEFGFQQADKELEMAHRHMVKDVRADHNNVKASIGQIKAYQQSVVSAKSALEATEAGFEVGTRTIVDVLNATRRMYSANRNLAAARYNYMLGILQLKHAVGSLNEQDILEINDSLIVHKAKVKKNKLIQPKSKK